MGKVSEGQGKMTTHDRATILAVAEQVKSNNDMFGNFSVALYTVAFEAGCVAERGEIADWIDSTDMSRIPPKQAEWLGTMLHRYAEAIRKRNTK